MNTMVKVVFRPEAVLTLFLRKHTEGVVKSLGKCMPIEELLPCYGKSRSPERIAWSYTAVSAHKRTILS